MIVRKSGYRYKELKLLERAGLIKDIQLQVKYELQPSFKKNGETYRAITYIADFVYYDNKHSKTIVEDVKSEATRKDKVYMIKKKMFMYKYQELEFKEIL